MEMEEAMRTLWWPEGLQVECVHDQRHTGSGDCWSLTDQDCVLDLHQHTAPSPTPSSSSSSSYLSRMGKVSTNPAQLICRFSNFQDTFNKVPVDFLHWSSLLIFGFRQNCHAIPRQFTIFQQTIASKQLMVFWDYTHVSDIIPTVQQWIIALSYNIFSGATTKFQEISWSCRHPNWSPSMVLNHSHHTI